MTVVRDPDIWETNSAHATFSLGESLGRSLVGGLAIGLIGPLGSGKTQLAKGIASGNALDEVCEVTPANLTDADARADGLAGLSELKHVLGEMYPPEERCGRRLFLVRFTYCGPDG